MKKTESYKVSFVFLPKNFIFVFIEYELTFVMNENNSTILQF